MINKKFRKRVLLGVGMGALFGLLCFGGFVSNPNVSAELIQFQEWSFSNLMMWLIITSKLLLGFVIALAGFVIIHPMLGFKFPVFLRGMMIGLYTSLPLAFGMAIGGGEIAVQTFWLILITGIIIGMIIDLVITKITGQGQELI